MSGGGSIPKAPDLSGNVKNADQTYGTATSNAQQTMNTANTYNDQAQKNLSNVVSQNNSMAGQIGANANQNFQTYGNTFVPLQQTQAKAAQNYGSEANVARLQGQAVANVNSANQAARSNSAAALASEGVDPASIHGQALDRQQSVMGAGQAANAGTQSAIQTQQQAFQMQNQANQLGMQVGQQGVAGAATGAGVLNQGQQTVNQTNNAGINNLTAANTYLNTGVNANKSSSDIASQGFDNQMKQNQAEQAQSAGLMSSIGSIAGMAGMMMMEAGGPVPQGAIPTSYSVGGNVTQRGALPVSPIPGSTDTKPALLTPGEFVIPKDVVDFKGQDFFHRQIDSIRAAQNKRKAIPTQHAPHISMH